MNEKEAGIGFMNPKITQAILLAAGFGNRLKPLTEKTPKPLLPFRDGKIIDAALQLLVAANISKTVVNLHYLGNQIQDYLEHKTNLPFEILFSPEANILGTGGGIKQAASLLKSEPVLCLNSDIIIDIKINTFIDWHFEHGFDSSMVLVPQKPEWSFTPVDADHDQLQSFGSGKYVYTGVQIVGPKLLKLLPKAGTKSCLIRDGYQKAIDQHIPVGAYIHHGFWSDLGTLARYEEAQKKK